MTAFAGYPVLLDLRDLPILVVGGGGVAARKVAALLEAGGRPEIVAPALVPELVELAGREGLRVHTRPYEAGEAARFRLVFAATDRADVNAQVGRDAEGAGGWANVADAPDRSRFHVPAVLRQGEVMVAVSTGAASPLLARRVRDRLGATVTPGLGRAALRLARLRGEVRDLWPADERRRRRFWAELVSGDFVDDAIAGRDDDVQRRIDGCLSRS